MEKTGRELYVTGLISYEGQCIRCSDPSYKYVGESSRTGYTRIKEHMSDYRAAATARLPPLPDDTGQQTKQRIKSWMWEHARDVHGGQVGPNGGENDYKFEVKNMFRKCLERQVDEEIRMKMREREGCILLNSKHEWFTPKTVEISFKQQ